MQRPLCSYNLIKPMLFIAFLVMVVTTDVAFVTAQVPPDFSAWREEKNADSVPTWVSNLINNRGFRNLSATEREEYLAQYLSGLKSIIADTQCVPSTRYNAVLAVGMLESQPGNPPTAYAGALPYLIEVYQGTDFPPYIKYGALLGMVRHAFCGMEPAQQEKVLALFLQTAVAEIVSANDEEMMQVHWFRQTALEGIAAMKTVGKEKIVVSDLLSLVERKTHVLDTLSQQENILTQNHWMQVRYTIGWASLASKTLGDLDYRAAEGIDAAKVAEILTKWTRATYNIEYKIAADYIGSGSASPDVLQLQEQMVIDIKTCIQSVVWGIRSGFVSGRPTEASFYTFALKDNPEAGRQLDMLLATILELMSFLDEGDKTNKKETPQADIQKAFKFDLLELRDKLSESAESLSSMADNPSEQHSAVQDVEEESESTR